MFKKYYLLIFSPLIVWPLAAKAGIFDSLGCVATGNCGLSDIESGFQLLTNWLLGGIGALGLLYFVWGAGQWITSYGKTDKISHGREIMIGSITAIFIALVSYILVQFFVNDVLLGGQTTTSTAQFMVSAECEDVARGQVCNEPLVNYVCSGIFEEEEKKNFNNLCINRCELENLTSDHNWTCINKEIIENLDDLDTKNVCPTDNQVCLNVDSVPPGALNISGTGAASAGENYPGCCQIGWQDCHPDNETNCRNQAGQFFARTCAEVNFCNPGYVQQSRGCCVSNTNPVACVDVSQGDICDRQNNVLIPYQNCSELDYCN